MEGGGKGGEVWVVGMVFGLLRFVWVRGVYRMGVCSSEGGLLDGGGVWVIGVLLDSLVCGWVVRVKFAG